MREHEAAFPLVGGRVRPCRRLDAMLDGLRQGGNVAPDREAAKQRVEPFHFPGHLVLRELQSLEAGIAGASSHSGRRTLITRLAERGIDLKAIAEIAGHTSIRTTAMYVEANPRRLARILQDVTW